MVISNNLFVFWMIMIVVPYYLIILRYGVIGIQLINLLKLKVTVFNKIGYHSLLQVIITSPRFVQLKMYWIKIFWSL